MNSTPHSSYESSDPAFSPPFKRGVSADIFGSIGLNAGELDRVQKLIFVPRSIKKGQLLFQAGQKFSEIFAVRSGSFRSGVVPHDGDLNVTGFQLPGDMVGFDGIATMRYACEVQALEDSEVSAMTFEHVATLSRELRPVQRLFLQMMSAQLVRDSEVLVMLGSLKAEERVAAFLLKLFERMETRGFSATELVLPMSRHDIASYLGLKTETVSRAFADLIARRLIEAHQRSVTVLNRSALCAMAKVALPQD
ncbi:MAG: helix-turn-helix domain-containing protein [Rhodoferax sp.]|nr:helix-turn-helix domain-containing protein [Rhodoferax sp.]